MKYFIRALADFGTTHAPSREPSSYSDAELTNGVDGIWQCGESENPDVFGKKYRCGGACHSDEARRRRALGGTDGYIFCFSVLSSIKNTTTNLGNKFLFVFVSIIFLDYSSDVQLPRNHLKEMVNLFDWNLYGRISSLRIFQFYKRTTILICTFKRSYARNYR